MAERSHAYPSSTILEIVDFVQQIYSKYGASTYVNREDIAKALNKASVTIQGDCSTAVQYGLFEMKSKAGYKPTPLFTQIYKPLNDAEKRSSLIQALSNPDLYSQLIRNFSNDIIPIDGLPTILFRNYHIAEKVSTKAANIFIENIKYLNLIDGEGKLRLASDNLDVITPVQETPIKELESVQVNTPTILNQHSTSNNNINSNNSDNVFADDFEQQFKKLTFNILLKKKRTAQLIIPQDSQKEDLETIKNWITLMKDSFD